MNKPNNYDQTPVQGERIEVKEGGHQLIIYQVVEKDNKKGDPMIVVQYDFAQGDVQAGLIAKIYKDDVSPEKKWPHLGTAYINVQDAQGNTSRGFKTFCSSVEASNPGFQIAWGDNFGPCFKKKLVGAVFGPVENEYMGKVTTRNELRWFCSVEKSKTAKVPELKALPVAKPDKSPTGTSPTDGFMDIPDNVEDDELPFN